MPGRRRGVDLFAAFPNIVVKLSGITTCCAPGTASVALVPPSVAHLPAAFGPERMLWGGDWPVVNLGGVVPGWIDMTRELLAGLPVEEQYAIGQGTARRVYGLWAGLLALSPWHSLPKGRGEAQSCDAVLEQDEP